MPGWRAKPASELAGRMALAFAVPTCGENPDGWGPCTVPEHLKDIPFAPFGKGDKIGRVSDWTQAAYQKGYQGRYGNQQGGPAVFNFFHNEEEEAFHLVDNRPVKTNKFGQGRSRFQQQQRFQQQRKDKEAKGIEEKKRGPADSKGVQKRQPWNQYGRDNQRQPTYSSSIEIRPDWVLVEQFDFGKLIKHSATVGEPKDICSCGTLEFYDKSVEGQATVRKQLGLEKTRRIFRQVTASDDPIIRDLAAKGTGRVFATDSVLSTLMCMRSSVYSWDIVATRKGDKLFLDWRNGSGFNLLTVNETAPDPVLEDKDSIAGTHQLSLECTLVNQNFSQHVLQRGGNKHSLEKPNPFQGEGEEGDFASVGYRYRTWKLMEGVDLVCRCEVDGVLPSKDASGAPQLVMLKALNEHDLRVQDWRKKIEQQRGAVFLTEAKNNKNKVSKWTVCALLAGCEVMKLGFVSRIVQKDNANHVLLNIQNQKPKDLAGQMALNLDLMWGTVRSLVESLLAQPEGKYLLLKDPGKEQLRLYTLAEDALEGPSQLYAHTDTGTPAKS